MTREHWVGFLMGALDENERDLVEQHIADDPRAAEQLDQLRSHLDLLSDGLDEAAPPAGLASRTCAILDNPDLYAEVLDTSAPADENAPQSRQREAFESIGGGRNSFTMMDMLVALGACVAAVAIFFPALASSRLLATRLQCENNLHQVSLALQQFAGNSPEHRYPAISMDGPMSRAGVFAPKLMDAGLINHAETVRCAAKKDELATQSIPTVQQLENAPREEVEKLQQSLSEVFNYNMGSLVNGKLLAPVMKGRANFPVSSDVVLLEGDKIVPQAHADGRANILFDDGHVEYMAVEEIPESLRQYFLNDEGQLAAGLNEDDAVVANGMAHPIQLPQQKLVP